MCKALEWGGGEMGWWVAGERAIDRKWEYDGGGISSMGLMFNRKILFK